VVLSKNEDKTFTAEAAYALQGLCFGHGNNIQALKLGGGL